MTTKIQDRIIAIEHLASGASIRDLADKYGLTYQGMAIKLRSPAMKELMAEVAEEVTMRAVQAEAFVRLNFPDYVKQIDGIARNPDHRDQFKSLSYLVDKVWPTVQEVRTQSTHVLEGEALHQVAETFAEIKEVVKQFQARDITKSPHLLEGDAAIPKPTALDTGNVDP